MEYDLYLDESGKFDSSKERKLIGGFLLPRKKADYSEQNALKMFYVIRNTALEKAKQKGLLNDEALKNGERKHYKSPDFDASSDWYIFDHCCENNYDRRENCLDRAPIQKFVLREFVKQITDRGGRVVLFEDRQRISKIDDNTTYLSCFALGLMRLYIVLKKEQSAEEVRVFVHSASRRNNTLIEEKRNETVSPCGSSEKTIPGELYINQVKNCVFLNGGAVLLEDKNFVRCLESTEIIRDIRNGMLFEPHPATILADYICNSAKSLMDGGTKYTEEDLGSSKIRISVFKDKLDFGEFTLDDIERSHLWDRALIRLISEDFPDEQETKRVFERMNADKRYNQLLCVNSIVNYVYPFVENRENMEEIAARLLRIIDIFKGKMAETAYEELKANLLIYLDALYTHLGDNEKAVQTVKEFIASVSGIPEAERRNALLIKYFNREIVSSTDEFDYARGRIYFEMIKKYYLTFKESGDELMMGFLEQIIGEETDMDRYLYATVSEYGKAIGSYMQLLAHELRSEEKSESKEDEAEEILRIADSEFVTQRDKARCAQNKCDLYIALKKFKEALDELYYSACGETSDGTWEEKCGKLAERFRESGKTDHYLLYHYVQLMHALTDYEMGLYAEMGTTMLSALIGNDTPDMVKKRMDEFTGNIYPGACIIRHFAVSLARLGGKYVETAKDLLQTAENMLDADQAHYTFAAIRLAVHTERLLLTGSKPASIVSEISREYANRFLPLVKERKNPFANVLPVKPGNEQDIKKQLQGLTKRIFY